MRHALTLLVLSCIGFAAPRAYASEASSPRVAVVVSAANDTDPFLRAYVHEVGATVFRSKGFEVAPPAATASVFASSGKSVMDCAAADECVSSLARSLFAPSLVFIEVTPLRRRRAAFKLITVVVTHDGVHRGEPQEAKGREDAMAEKLRLAAERFAEHATPCRVSLESVIDELSIRMGKEGSPLVFPVFLPEGSYELFIEAESRPSTQRTFTCAAGRHYRVMVE